MFDLVRLQRLQMQPPDPIVQIGVLRTMIGQMIEQSHTFEFRLNSFETLHSLSGAANATQQQVEKYWRCLAAESREMLDGVDQTRFDKFDMFDRFDDKSGFGTTLVSIISACFGALTFFCERSCTRWSRGEGPHVKAPSSRLAMRSTSSSVLRCAASMKICSRVKRVCASSRRRSDARR